jgi:succinate dehydrogenase / fumarate reductase membrane anchor subunit
MVKREAVGAHHALGNWIAQRVTAVVMTLYTALILAKLAGSPVMDYRQWTELWQAPVVRYATVLFMACLLVHAWVGMRSIFMDYIKPPALRLALQGLVIAALLWYGVWLVRLLWSL